MITKGNVVSIFYIMYDPAHNIVDTNEEYAPLTYVHGDGSIRPEFEKALEGMNVNESKVVSMDAASEYSGYSCTIRVASILEKELKDHDAVFIPISHQACCGPGGCC